MRYKYKEAECYNCQLNNYKGLNPARESALIFLLHSKV